MAKITKDQFSAKMVMAPRKAQNKPASDLPGAFLKDVAKLFNSQFEQQRGNASFSVHGALYPNEVLLCITVMQVGMLRAASCYTSMDLPKNVAQNPKAVTENLRNMVDLVASWFNQCFDESESTGLEAILEAINEMDSVWEAVEWEKQKIFVLVNRDNHTLEAAADQILREGEN